MTRSQIERCRRALALMLREKIIPRKAYIILDKRLSAGEVVSLASFVVRTQLVDSLAEEA